MISLKGPFTGLIFLRTWVLNTVLVSRKPYEVVVTLQGPRGVPLHAQQVQPGAQAQTQVLRHRRATGLFGIRHT